MKTFNHFAILFTFLAFLITGCEKSDGDTDMPSPSLKKEDTALNSIGIRANQNWFQNGDNCEITIDNLDFTSKVPGVELKSVKLMSGDKELTQKRYSPEMTVSCRIENWQHGKNNISIMGIFGNDDNSVEVFISTLGIYVFNTCPSYKLGGTIGMEISMLSSNGEEFNKYAEYSSNNQIINIGSKLSWVSSNGELPDVLAKCHFIPFIVTENTNFECTIQKPQIHWKEFSNPAQAGYNFSLTQDAFNNNLNLPVYAEMVITGVHEGIEISEKVVASYSIINNN